MCCLFCVEIQQEKLSAEQVHKLFWELMIAGDEKHLENLEKVLDNISQPYKEKLNEQANEQVILDDPDPFDIF